MKEVTDEQIYQKLNMVGTERLENMTRRLHVGAVPYRRFARREDLIDTLWFSMDNEFPRERLVKVLFGRTSRRKKHRVHLIKKHAIRMKYKLHHRMNRKTKNKKHTKTRIEKSKFNRRKRTSIIERVVLGNKQKKRMRKMRKGESRLGSTHRKIRKVLSKRVELNINFTKKTRSKTALKRNANKRKIKSRNISKTRRIKRISKKTRRR